QYAASSQLSDNSSMFGDDYVQDSNMHSTSVIANPLAANADPSNTTQPTLAPVINADKVSQPFISNLLENPRLLMYSANLNSPNISCVTSKGNFLENKFKFDFQHWSLKKSQKMF